jgi:hypothetical protein
VRRLALLVALLLAASGCNWSLGYHWPRTTANGSSATETLVYFQNDVIWYQGPYVQWARDQWSRSSAVHITMVDVCPAGRNCVIWRTREISPYAGLTSIAGPTAMNRHLTFAVIDLDPDVGRVGTVAGTKNLTCHEGGHGLGGGFENPALSGSEHFVCNGSGYPTSHDFADLAAAYDHRL